jgi:hypothetical protein
MTNQIHESIAQQIDCMRPPHLRPREHVVMEVLDDQTLRVLVRTEPMRCTDIRYDAGPDTYTVTRYEVSGGLIPSEPISDVYCDQLGEIVFGDEAMPFTLPLVAISDDDGETWEVIA